jgi:predicted oxidoreductase
LKYPDLRDNIFIQSKCAIRDGLYDFSRDYILRSVDGILSRLGTDHLDCLLLHRPDALMDLDEVQQAFSRLHEEGKVLSFGVSNMNRFQMELLQSGVSFPIVADQIQMSLAHTPLIDEGINVNTMFEGAVTRSSGTLEYCRLKGIIVQTWSPLQKGFFDGCFLGDPDYDGLNQVLDRLADKYNVKSDSIAYAWLLRYPAMMQVIAGTMNSEHIISAAKAADIDLTREEWYELYRSAGNELP